ncbi:SRPBCC family protein [Sphingomonas sp. MMS24-J13]|uniref:SRPBCC family protein n=1 Tax=Sphingomonas sp. MMS24-J13 TaxID=3238686 RepID=UPI00384E37B3
MVHATYATDSRTLSLTRDYPHPIAKVWAAISTPARIAAWMGVTWIGDESAPLHEGARFDYHFGNTDLPSHAHVLRFDPPHLLEHSWFENEPPAATVRWALEERGNGTRLTLTHLFPIGEDAPRTGAGWTTLMEALAASLDGVPFAPPKPWWVYRDDYARAFGPEATRDARLARTNGRQILTFDRILHHKPQAVWSALTTSEGLARWMQSRVELEPKAGGRIHFLFQDGPHTMTGEIVDWDPPRVFAFTWDEGETAGDSVVRFELFDDPAGCRLRLTHDFAEGVKVGQYASGWHWHLDGLDDAAEGLATPWNAGRWRVLDKMYAVTLAMTAK